MRATIKNYIAALKQRREEHGQSGFSLIELIVVVAILGILVAIAIPVFGSIQATAANNALKTSAANAATQIAAAYASDPSATTASVVNLSDHAAITFSVTGSGSGVAISASGDVTFTSPVDVSKLCVHATKATVTAQDAGPGC